MPISLTCSCSKKLHVRDELAGKVIRCPGCSTTIRVPIQGVVESPVEDKHLAAASPATSRAKPRVQPVATKSPPPKSEPETGPVTYEEQLVVLSQAWGLFSGSIFSVTYVLSPNGRRVFHSGGQSSTLGLVVGLVGGPSVSAYTLDGQPFQPGHPFAPNTVVFTPDSQKLAYAAKLGDRWYVLLDGRKASDGFDEIRDIRFSVDGCHIAFAAQQSRGWCVVLDGKRGPSYDQIEDGGVLLSNDGGLLAYGARRGKQRLAVINGEEIDVTVAAGRVTDPTGSRQAWNRRKGRGWCVCLGGEDDLEYEKIGSNSLRFSSDGRHFAYTARRGGKWFVVCDGRESPGHDRIDHASLTFSPDAKRFAYIAGVGSWWQVWRAGWKAVIDGREGPLHGGVAKVWFSPDGKRVAYAASKGTKSFMVVDGIPEGRWPAVSDFVFSPDSRHHAYIAGSEAEGQGGQRVAFDGQEGKKYDAVADLRFTPEGNHLVYMAIGEKHSEPKPGFFELKRRGGFLVTDERESDAWLLGIPTQYNKFVDRVISSGFTGPRAVYVVTLFANSDQVSFTRLDLACKRKGRSA